MADKFNSGAMGAEYNARFLEALQDEGTRRKLSMAMGQYTRKKVYEGLMMENIIPSETVTPADLVPTMVGDALYKIDELEPEATALEVNWDGNPTGEYFEGERFITPIWTVTSERLQKSEDELLAIRYPAREVLTDIASKEIIRKQDEHFFGRLCEAAVAHSGKSITSPDNILTMDALSALQNEIDGNELNCTKIVMNRVDFNNLKRLAGPEADTLSAEILTKGFVSTTYGGLPFLVTIKNTAVAPGTVWAFTAPEFLGTHYVLQDTKFEVKSEFRMVEFQGWRKYGTTISNVNSVAKLTLGVAS